MKQLQKKELCTIFSSVHVGVSSQLNSLEYWIVRLEKTMGEKRKTVKNKMPLDCINLGVMLLCA